MKFLESVALHFYQNESAKLSEFCFVFPNRRSGLFFQKYLGEIVQKPLFSPKIFTIKDFIISVSGMSEADKIDSLFRLYSIYKEISGSPESFDDFVFWGEVILDDFNDVDKFMADARLLFANIKELKEIESDYSFLSQNQSDAILSFWEGFLPVGNSRNKQNFKAMWQLLYPIYSKFREQLALENTGYEGMIFRQVASDLKCLDKLTDYREIIFVGLNALNRCEKEILTELKRRGMADFYWDYYGDFITDSQNRASHFMTENLNSFPSKRDIKFDIFETPQIEVIGVSSGVMQTKIVSGILENCGKAIENAVVLPDERLLLPMLYSIPERFSEVNITMGYPLKGSPVLSLIQYISDLGKDNGRLYYKRVLSILQHNNVKMICEGGLSNYIEEIKSKNMIFISPSFFDDNPFLKLIFTPVEPDNESARHMCEKLVDIMDYLAESHHTGRIEREFIYYIKATLVRISGIIIPMSIDTFSRLLTQILGSLSIPFRGEPLSGLQIMGVLETRALDFENIIYCSLNEGTFPSSGSSNSFIPYNIRRGFMLPVKEYNDAIASYHFYRSIYRAKRVWLLYDTRTEGLNTGEMSRFILQMKYHYNLSLNESRAAFKVKAPLEKIVEVEKSADVIAKMESMFLTGERKPLSATAIGTYILCPLQFYLSYVEDVKEEDKLTEEIEYSEFGSIFHYVMERLYSKYTGRLVSERDIKELISNRDVIDTFANAAFLKYRNITEFKGYNLLIKNLIIRYVQLVLKYDLKLTPFEYISSEKKIETKLSFNPGREVLLKGFIDRIDKVDTFLRIVDYKTGKGDQKNYRDVNELFESAGFEDKKVAFQMLFYAMILDVKQEIKIAPYILRNMGKSGGSDQKEINPTDVKIFREGLTEVIKEIFDSGVKFSGNRGSNSCKWCPYSSICF